MGNFAVSASEEIINQGNALLEKLQKPGDKKGDTLKHLFEIVEANIDTDQMQQGGIDTRKLDASLSNIRSMFVSMVGGQEEILASYQAKIDNIKALKDKLEEERSNLELILGSERRLNTLIKKEIQEDAKKYASPRMSQLVEREEAKAISESEMTPAEPVTVILSEMGWVRCAKGHDIDPAGLSYKAGDKYLAHACGKSNQPVIFIDSTGRSYALDPLSLPSARSQGEPLTGKLTLPAGATIEQVIMEPEKQELLMASDAGYGFICKFEDLIARNKAGKALISLPENAKVLKPEKLSESASLLVSLTSAGRMLIFPVRDLPALSKGKGNKIISIPAANAKARSELLVKLFLISEQASLEFHSGKRKITLKPEDLQKFRAERGRKGSQLPRGLHSNVDIVVVEPEHNS